MMLSIEAKPGWVAVHPGGQSPIPGIAKIREGGTRVRIKKFLKKFQNPTLRFPPFFH